MSSASPSSPGCKVAILFRYGAAEHVNFLPALPELARQLSEQGCDVHHFGFRGKTPLDGGVKNHLTERRGPFRVRRWGRIDKWVKAVLWLAWLPWLGRRLKNEGFTHVFVDETLPLSADLLKMTYPGRLCFTVHDFFLEIYWMRSSLMRWPGRWMQQRDERAWRSLDRLFVRVEAAKQALTGRGVAEERIDVVPDSVDLNLFAPARDAEERTAVRERWGFGPEEVVMVHHGVLHPNKGNALLVHALFRLRHKLPTLKLVIVGDGPERLEVERAVGTCGLEDRVVVTGWLPGLEDIASLLRAADIGLVMRKGVPGDEFHVTSTLVHNAGAGLPLLAARLAGISEVVEEGEHGYLFDPSAGKEFDYKLIRLVKEEEDRKRMGGNARQLAEKRFDPVLAAKAYANGLLA